MPILGFELLFKVRSSGLCLVPKSDFLKKCKIPVSGKLEENWKWKLELSGNTGKRFPLCLPLFLQFSQNWNFALCENTQNVRG